MAVCVPEGSGADVMTAAIHQPVGTSQDQISSGFTPVEKATWEAAGDTASARSTYASWGKPVIDYVLSFVLLSVLAIPMAAIALVISATQSGTPFFFQKRVGEGEKLFSICKFRTMRTRNDDVLEFLLDTDGQVRHKIRQDPRITPVGKILRETSLDEIPQLINVLRGEMSLVGPRPELPQIVEHYEPWQHARHTVRPGITGWWQVSGRSDLPMHEHTDLDLYYVQRQSITLDLQVVARTVSSIFLRSGAF
jgi:lipopolysaccharide/colanic/teichoic acid biosynthesis glycosyltransferase